MTGQDIAERDVADFQATVWRYYDEHGRHDLPWRLPDADGVFDPYKILVSEVMLQQTQVVRVIPKYLEFLRRFPTVRSLAQAALGDVLVAWQGLGYNRRAKYLWQAAQRAAAEFEGQFPPDQAKLVSLPGVGINTAAAIVAYAYNQPAIFIETNIRTVLIHHFFGDRTGIADKELVLLVSAALPQIPQTGLDETVSYRSWYWALMDYGVHLKRTVGNKSRASKSYTKQPPFTGSRRQVRGAVIRHLGLRQSDRDQLQAVIDDPRLDEVLDGLVREGMIRYDAGIYRLH